MRGSDQPIDPGTRTLVVDDVVPAAGGSLVVDLRPGRTAPARVLRDSEVQQIIEAAWVVLDRSGWECLKIDLVVTEARVSTRSFYRHFKSKNELLVVLLEDEITHMSHVATALAQSDLDPIDQVLAWIESTVSLACDPRTAGRARLFLSLWWGLAREFPVDIDQCMNLLLAPLVDILERGRTAGMFPLADPWPDAKSILYLTIGRMSEFINQTDRAPMEAAALAERFVLRSLTGSPDRPTA